VDTQAVAREPLQGAWVNQERDVAPCGDQLRADVAAPCSCPNDQNAHDRHRSEMFMLNTLRRRGRKLLDCMAFYAKPFWWLRAGRPAAADGGESVVVATAAVMRPTEYDRSEYAGLPVEP
jgi:hypothetical protein